MIVPVQNPPHVNRPPARRGLAATGIAALALLIAAMMFAPPAAAAKLESPDFAANLNAFKKALKSPTEASGTLDDRIAAVNTLAQTRDERVFKELFKVIGSLRKQAANAKSKLDDATEKLVKAQVSYFEWVEAEYRRTGKLPGHGLKRHIDAVETLTKKQREEATIYDHFLTLRETVANSLELHLKTLGDDRKEVWDSAVKLGTSSRDPMERAAFCDALAVLRGQDVGLALLSLEAKEKHPVVLVGICRALGNNRIEGAYERLLPYLEHDNWRVASAAARSLALYRNKEVIPALIARLETVEGRRLVDILDTLFDMTGKRLADTHTAWKNWWERDAEKFLVRWSDDPSVRTTEIERISMTDPNRIDVASELAALLRSEPEQDIRLDLVSNLSLQRSQVARYRLLEVLRDTNDEIRIAAIRGLAHFRHLSVPEELMRLVDTAVGEELEAIYQSLRTLWGGVDEFSIGQPSRENLHNWWDTNKNRVGNQFVKLRARGFAAGVKQPAPIEGRWRDRNFYGLRLYSERVLFVVDLSLSMEEPAKAGETRKKIEVAKAELSRAIKSLSPEAEFGVITFSGFTQMWDKGMIKASASAKKRAMQWVEELETHAATNIYDALELAFQLGEAGSKYYRATEPDTIYLVSDGQPTAGKFIKKDEILRHVDIWNENRGLKIHAIGVGPIGGKNGHDLEFLRALAEKNHGFYVAR